MIGTFIQDLRHGARLLVRSPGFALIAILSIGVGVGATAAMFSLADGLLLRPLRIPSPGSVVSVFGTSRERGGLRPLGLSYPDYLDVRDRTRSFEHLTAFNDVLVAFDARPDRLALRTMGAAVDASLFETAGITTAVGRYFRADEDTAPGRDAVVVLDYRTWQERFGGDPQIVGRRVRITNTDFTVIGVAPEPFNGLGNEIWPAFYIPLAMIDVVQPGAGNLTRRDAGAMEVKGRLRADVTMDQAREELARIGAELEREHPQSHRGRSLTVRTEFDVRTSGGGPDAGLVAMLMTLAAAVLIVACANVAGLLASRAPIRAREIALRQAVGAGRWRMVRQLVTESLLIATGGGVVGLVIAYGAIELFRQIEFPTEVPLKLFFELDRRVLIPGLTVATSAR